MVKKQLFSHPPTWFGLTIFLCCWFAISVPLLQGNVNLFDRANISGWNLAGKPYDYGPQNLFEHINGAADFFIAYGFVSLKGAHYFPVSTPNDSVTVDIYDMGEKLNAFGVFQAKRSQGTPSLKIGTASFGSEGYLAFYKDRYFVEINSFITHETWGKKPLVIARKLADNLPGDILPPRELSYFPEPGKVKRSERYIRGGVLGHAFLDKGIICDYRIEDETVSAFLAFFPSKKATVNAYEQHMTFLEESGKCSLLEGVGDRGLISQEPYHKNIIIVQKGSFEIGVYDLSSPQKGMQILKGIIERLGSGSDKREEPQDKTLKEKGGFK
ncbi:MAG: hypothetical protein JRF40_13810 [Deltaproteobacteria bacterium]|nr:hypothetical protein [Deltaproteobacteria bacterium]